MSIIRYKYKADKNFESVKIDGTSCSVGEFKRLIVDRSSKSGGHHPRDDYDLTISNANTHEEYKDNSDLIPRNTSVIVARRIRGSVEPITPLSNQRPVVSSDDIVNEFLRPAIQPPTQHTSSSSSPVVEGEAVPLEMLIQSATGAQTKVMSEDERIKEIQKDTQTRYLTSHRPNGPHVCHNCKQPGHIRTQCPLLSGSSNSSGNTSSTGDHPSKNDGTQSTGSGSSLQPMPHPSHIVTHHSPYQLSYHPRNSHYNNRTHHRNAGHPREPPPKKTTGIPRADLLQIPHHIQGALRDQSGTSVVPLQMAKYHVEKIEMKEKKEAALARRAQQFQEKGVLPPAPPASMLPAKPSEDDIPSNLLCPLCKRVYVDAVITPCCNLSFCDECIRTALIESEDHECPKCHRQHVAIDQINPNIFLRDHVNCWRNDRQQKTAYPNMSQPVVNYAPSQTLDSDFDMTLARNPSQNDADDYDTDTPSNPLPQQHTAPPVKTAPIVIKMQPPGRSPSPPPIVSTKPADMTFEDGKAPDADSAANSQMDTNSVAPGTFRPDEGPTNANATTAPSSASEGERSERMTPPSQVAPVSTILSSPPTTTTTTMVAPSVPVPHYYPAPPHITHHQPPHPHHNIIYSQQMPVTSSTGLYPMPPNYYQSPIPVPYPGPHHPGGGYPMMQLGVPPGPAAMHHILPPHPTFAPGPHHHPAAPHHMPPNPLNGFHSAAVVPFEAANAAAAAALHPHHHPGATFAASSISTLIAHHHQTGPQPIPTALSKDEFYMKQRYLQRIRRSSSRRSRSRSSSVSSYSSSDSRSSSFSRRRRRSSRSRSRRRTSVRRHNSRPITTNHVARRERRRSSRSNSKQRRSPGHRSPSYRGRRRAIGGTSDTYSSKYRRPSPRPHRSTHDRERRRSPRPPPTVQQSTQRTIVYMHESSSSKHHSGRDRRRTKSRSRHRSRGADERVASSSKTEQQTKSILPSSPVIVLAEHQQQQTPTTLPSIIEPVVEEIIPPPSLTLVDSVQSDEKLLVGSASTIQSAETLEEKNSNSGKKRKKHHHHHHKKHHRSHRSKSQSSKSKKRHRSKNNDKKTIVDSSTAVVEAQ